MSPSYETKKPVDATDDVLEKVTGEDQEQVFEEDPANVDLEPNESKCEQSTYGDWTYTNCHVGDSKFSSEGINSNDGSSFSSHSDSWEDDGFMYSNSESFSKMKIPEDMAATNTTATW